MHRSVYFWASKKMDGVTVKQQVIGFLVFLFAACIGSLTHSQTTLSLVCGTSDQNIDLSLEQLLAMDQIAIKTTNEFVDGKKTYSGPLARDVLHLCGEPHGETATLVAANDYQVDVAVKEFHQYDVILALSMDGKMLSNAIRARSGSSTR